MTGRALKTSNLIAALVLILPALFACDEENPFRTIQPGVTTGESQVWELGLPTFPSAFDFAAGMRFFLHVDTGPGHGQGGLIVGDWILAEAPDGSLALRAVSTVAPSLALTRTGIQDLGAIPFESVTEVPEGGYASPDDSIGVEVVAGHVYAFRITDLLSAFAPVNYAKLEVTDVGQQFPGDPASRFIRFRWAYQRQPLNRNLTE